MPKVFTSKTQKLGEIGENLACAFLMKHGFSIVERNFTISSGEIDIIAKKKGIIHFVEVKSASANFNHSVTRATTVDPMENMHPMKMKKFLRVVQTYLLNKDISEDFSIDLAIVYIDEVKKQGKVELFENIA
ncbi:MAG: YraN family protein [bacterium]